MSLALGYEMRRRLYLGIFAGLAAAGLLFELFRSKGQIEILGRAKQEHGIVDLRVRVKNLDWGCSLRKFYLSIIGTDDAWEIVSTGRTGVTVTNAPFGPGKIWQEAAVILPANEALGPRKE